MKDIKKIEGFREILSATIFYPTLIFLSLFIYVFYKNWNIICNLFDKFYFSQDIINIFFEATKEINLAFYLSIFFGITIFFSIMLYIKNKTKNLMNIDKIEKICPATIISLFRLFHFYGIFILFFYFLQKYNLKLNYGYIFIIILVGLYLIKWLMKLLKKSKKGFSRIIYLFLLSILFIEGLKFKAMFIFSTILFSLIYGMWDIVAISLFFFLTYTIFLPLVKKYEILTQDYRVLELLSNPTKLNFLSILNIQNKKKIQKTMNTLNKIILNILYKNENKGAIESIFMFLPLMIAFLGLIFNLNILTTIYLILTSIYWFWAISIILPGWSKGKVDVILNKKSINNVFLIEEKKDAFLVLNKQNKVLVIMKTNILYITQSK